MTRSLLAGARSRRSPRSATTQEQRVMKANKLVLAAMLVGAGVASLATIAQDKGVMHKMVPAMTPLPVEGELSSLGSATEWLNSQPLTAASLRRKVILMMSGPIPASTGCAQLHTF